MGIKRYKGQPLPIVVNFPSDPLIPYNAVIGDVTDVRMTLKKDTSYDSDDLYLEKTQGGSGINVDAPNFKFIMDIGEDDYANLRAGENYYLTLAVYIPSYTNGIELELEDDEVIITADKTRS